MIVAYYLLVMIAVASIFAIMAVVELLIMFEWARGAIIKNEEVKRDGVQGSRYRKGSRGHR